MTVHGVVQGVGFRPFVFNAARHWDLAGWVLNEADTVRIEVAGSSDRVKSFLETLRESPPTQAQIDAIDVVEVDSRANHLPDEFEIRASQGVAAPRPTIPADLATCAECLTEIHTESERRYRYPFTNCTNCGPRWSIIERLPYDRPHTSMATFEMCADCRREYEDPTDRRFHAQPIACPACGPQLELLDVMGRHVEAGDEALRLAVSAVHDGQVVAVKGLGGFQLLVDATNDDAVRRTRDRKRRYDKPLAVMIRSLEEVRQRCLVSDEEADMLQGSEAPILLLRLRNDEAATADIAPTVAPANPYLGVMLPYTPLHHLLMDAIDRLPSCAQAVTCPRSPWRRRMKTPSRGLGRSPTCSSCTIAPSFVLSTTRSLASGSKAPRSYVAPEDTHRDRSLLPTQGHAFSQWGGHLKNTVALAIQDQAVVSQHIGDLDNLASIEVHRQTIADLVEFFRCQPEAVACDMHPDYASTRTAERLAIDWKVPLVPVQHHHAHVAACMAEHGLEGPALGFSWDGTGYGDDGTVWGGEVLLCGDDGFSRVGHLRTFALPGGDRAGREPRCSAAGLLYEIMGPDAVDVANSWFRPMELTNLITLLKRQVNSPRTSSMGRLFDAVACLCGLAPVISFEGEAAMDLEFAVDENETAAYPLDESDGPDGLVADWEPLVRAILEDRRFGLRVEQISARFHNAIVEWTVSVLARIDCPTVVLSGGCFQNAVLATRITTAVVQTGPGRIHSEEGSPWRRSHRPGPIEDRSRFAELAHVVNVGYFIPPPGQRPL